MADRSATDTIRGYFYQFDYTIQRLLELESSMDMITVEGVEDIDESTAGLDTAIQCKYYAKTEYNHSVIAKPVRLMLSHFDDVEKGNTTPVTYYIYGHFKSGHDKYPSNMDIEFLKKNLLTYTENKVRCEHHSALGLTDSQLAKFISILDVDVHAQDYESQQSFVVDLLKSQFNCDDDEALWHYYPNAVRSIKDLATQGILANREISKGDFLIAINRKETLFNAWFIQLKGAEAYFKGLKKKYFTALNVSPAHRLFLIESKDSNTVLPTVKDVMRHISFKFSKLTKRSRPAFCPYVYLHNVAPDHLIKIKSDLLSEGFKVVDGYDFLGATFSVSSIGKEPEEHTEIKLKILNVMDDVEAVLTSLTGKIEVYQFYADSPFLTTIAPSVKRVEIELEKLEHLINII